MSGKLPNFLLICATDMEMRAAVSLLPGAQGLELRASMPHMCRRGQGGPPFPALPRLTLRGAVLHLLICGVGPVASALAVAQLLGKSEERLFVWHGVLNMGLAGSYDPQAAPLGSLVLAEEERLPEYGIWPEPHECLHGPQTALPEGQRDGAFAEAGAPLPMTLPQTQIDCGPVYGSLSLEPDNALGNMGLSCHTEEPRLALRRGVSLTVAGVSGTPARAARLCRLFGGLVENMEGFPLALACRRTRLPFVELRAVSNEAGQRPPVTWDMPGAFSALAEGGRTLFSSFF